MPTKTEKKAAPTEKVALYDKLIATIPEIERKGSTVPYTSLNGNMFSYLHNDGTLALRLSEKDRADFIKKHSAELMQAYGIVQKEYIAVPEKVLADTKEMEKYLKLSFEYAKTLKSKPAKKK
jgi:hypothetical protein